MTVTAHLKTSDQTRTTSTSHAGSAKATFPLGSDEPPGRPVPVDVDIANGTATCQTSFTPS